MFGLALSREVNILALVAFVMSLVSIGMQVWQYLEGARVALDAGDRVNLVFVAPPADPDTLVLVINAALGYTNTGAVGRDALIVDERVVIDFGNNKKYEYLWFHFEYYVAEASGQPQAIQQQPAHDFVVPGAGAEGHQTTFVGFNGASVRTSGAQPDPISLPTFVKLTRSESTITLLFLAWDAEGVKYEESCQLALTEEIMNAINAIHWATALCPQAGT